MIEWLFPVRCPVCMEILFPRDGRLVHTECVARIKPLAEPLCMRCGRPLDNDVLEYCRECGTTRAAWDIGRSVFAYQGELKAALHRLKNEGTKEVVRYFAVQMAESRRTYLDWLKPEALVPVPMHAAAKRRRGFNQAELLAGALQQETGVPMLPLLRKIKKTKAQKSLSREQRKRNLRDAFALAEKYQGMDVPLPHTVLLVDDVVTTGSTLHACAAALKAHGVQKVGFLCVFCSGE